MPKSPQPDNNRDFNTDRRKSDNRRELWRYAGLSTQVAASVGLSVFVGLKADKWLHFTFPVLACGLPLLVIVVLIVKLVKESSRRGDGNQRNGN
jgi:hypothetical protein